MPRELEPLEWERTLFLGSLVRRYYRLTDEPWPARVVTSLRGYEHKREPISTLNRFGVTASHGQVVLVLRPSQVLEPEQALQLAAWLIVGHELATLDDNGLELVREAIESIKRG